MPLSMITGLIFFSLPIKNILKINTHHTHLVKLKYDRISGLNKKKSLKSNHWFGKIMINILFKRR